MLVSRVVQMTLVRNISVQIKRYTLLTICHKVQKQLKQGA